MNGAGAAVDRHEADLIAVARRRDRDAFARLFAFYAPRVKAYLARSGAETAAAEELAQNVMLALWRHADRFEAQKVTASTWVFTLARDLRGEALPDVAPPLDPIAIATTLRDDVATAGPAVAQALDALTEAQLDVLRGFYHGPPSATGPAALRQTFARLWASQAGPTDE